HAECRTGTVQRGRPAGLLHEIRRRIGLQQADDDLGDDAPSDGTEMEPAGVLPDVRVWNEAGFLPHVVEERRVALEAHIVLRELFEVAGAEYLGADRARDRLTRRQRPA